MSKITRLLPIDNSLPNITEIRAIRKYIEINMINSLSRWEYSYLNENILFFIIPRKKYIMTMIGDNAINGVILKEKVSHARSILSAPRVAIHKANNAFWAKLN